MRTCFVPLCDVKNKDQPNRTMFMVPKDKSQLIQWVNMLPNIRTLRSNDKVCHLHFDPEDVVYTFDHIINGQIYQLKRDRPKLKPNAVPYREMPTKDELVCYKVKTRLISNSKVSNDLEESIVEQESLEFNSQDYQTNNELQLLNYNEEEQQIDSNTETIEKNFLNNIQLTNDVENSEAILLEENQNSKLNQNLEEIEYYSTSSITPGTSLHDLFNLIYDNVYEILIPNTLWGIHRCPNRSIIYFTYMDMDKMQHTKMITIDSDGFIKIYVYSNLIKQLHLMTDICNLDNLSCLLNEVNTWRYCFGRDSSPECEIIVEASADNCWCTDENEQVFFCTICLPSN